jgi:ApbE superfamily uncharacterized protein (UPF0280 family)
MTGIDAMKSKDYQQRFYRDWVRRQDLNFIEVIVEETDVLISADKKFAPEKVRPMVEHYRQQIKDYIAKNKVFLTSLEPVKPDNRAPVIIQDMIRATAIAGVGPMASVAGAVAEYLGKELLKECSEVMVENGGDIFIQTKKVRSIGVYAGDSVLSRKVALKINPQDTPCGICCSSGTVGHSLSFGKADAAVVVADSAILADALATAVCNRVKSKETINDALEFAKKIPGVKGVLIILKDNLSLWGKIQLA